LGQNRGGEIEKLKKGTYMKYNFDEVNDRSGTANIKWEFLLTGDEIVEWDRAVSGPKDARILPLWIADMDFRSPAPVVEALAERAKHGFFGYTGRTRAYNQAVIDWMGKRHGWQIEADWILTTPGVIPSIDLIIRTFTQPGEKVLVQPPVYYPFYDTIESNDRVIVHNPLLIDGGRYGMDFADLEIKTRDPHVKIALLCTRITQLGGSGPRGSCADLGRFAWRTE
jgi:cystathionine beta-lyase